MNLILLLAGVRVWTGTPVERVTRFFLAVSIFSLEMQLATWTAWGTLSSILPFNLALAAGLFAWRGSSSARARRSSQSQGIPMLWLGGLLVIVVVLNLRLPLEAADPYHLDRAARIGRIGTLAYLPVADSRMNVLGWIYELILADLLAVPVVGTSIVRLHGAFGVLLFVGGLAAAAQLLGRSSRVGWYVLLSVPVAFHQFVLLKNDLFGAIPALLALAWLVARLTIATPMEIAWAMWLAGIAVAMKVTMFPLALVVGITVVAAYARDVRRLSWAMLGGTLGLLAGGVLFTLVENARMYGDGLEPFFGLGNRTSGPGEATVSASRFLISLFDLGTLTRQWWPGRGGWGATYGLPLLWAGGVAFYARRRPEVRRAACVVGAYWLAFAAVYPDADLAHRLVLAPGLLLILVASGVMADRDASVPAWLEPAGRIVAALSGAQVARSAVLYLVRA